MMILTARIAALLTLASLSILFASAGMLVQDARGLDLHGTAAIAIHLSSGILALALTVRAGVSQSGAPTAVAAIALFGLSFAQAAVGSYMTLALHVSGALVVTVLAAWITFWTFTAQPNHHSFPLKSQTADPRDGVSHDSPSPSRKPAPPAHRPAHGWHPAAGARMRQRRD